MKPKIKTLLLLTIIITTIILHTEKTPIVYAYTQTEHNNQEYVNWIYLKPISPQTEHLIKPPDIIELKNGEFTNIQYTIYTYQIIINNPNNNDLIDYQVKIPITYSDVGDSFIWGAVGSIRIYDQNGQELPYWVESWDSNTKDAVIWVKVPRIPAGGSITLTLESSAKYSDKSDGDAVFEFFDDFDGNSLDTSKWNVVVNRGTIEVVSGYLRLYRPAGNKAIRIESIDSFSGYKVIEYRMKILESNHYFTSVYYGASPSISSIGYSLYPTYETALYTGDSYNPPRSAIGASTNGDIITNPPVNTWFTEEFIIGPGNLKRVLNDEITEEATRYTGVSSGKIGIYVNSALSYAMETHIDYILVRKYAEVEPTVKIVPYGSTTVQYTVYTHQVVVSNPNDYDLIDYQVKIPITYSDVGDSFTWAKEGSIRIYDQSGQELPYWVESWDSNTKDAVIWVKVPKIPAGGSITLTLESSFKYSDKSDGYAVFDFFDDFETWEGWTQYRYGIVSQSSEQARSGTYSAKKYAYGDPNGAYKSLGFTLNYPFVLEAWVNRVYLSGANSDRIGVIDDNGNGYGLVVNMNEIAVYVDKRSSYRVTPYNIVSLSQSVTNDWYFARFIWDNGNMKVEVYYNGVLLGSTTYTDTAYSSFTRVYIFGGYTYYVDDLRIRKYAEVEPVVKIVS